MRKLFLLIGLTFIVTISNSQGQITFPFVNFDLNATPRTQLNSMSIKLFDDYHTYRPSAATAPGNNSYGTLLAIYGRSNHWEQNLYFGANTKKMYFRTSTWSGGTAEDGTVGGFHEWRVLLDSKSNIESNGLLKLTGNGDHYLSQGNVGIGTTTPNRKLTIFDATLPVISLGKNTSNVVQLSYENDYGSLQSVISGNVGKLILNGGGGNVGIGTTSPQAKLSLGSSVIDQKLLIYDNANYRYGLGMTSGSMRMFCQSAANLEFGTISNTDGQTFSQKMIIKASGNIGIGTTNPQSLLAVNGTITSKEVVVTLDGWSDFVFNPDYKLKDLEEVENFIAENKHLPDVPSESEVLENGVALGEMDAKLLQKIEELTLYMIEMNKEMKALKQKNTVLENEIEKLKTE